MAGMRLKMHTVHFSFNILESNMNHIAARTAFILLSSVLVTSQAQADFKDEMLKQLGNLNSGSNASAPATETATPSSTALSGLSQSDMSKGLKEALSKGVKNAISQLGKNNGFLNDPSVKIPMPGSLAKVESLMRTLHQDKLADQFVATMNHAAEKAVPEAASVFSDAIKSMTLEDAEGILKGPDDAATQYFRKKSEATLTERFRPIVSSATAQAGVTASYKKMMNKAGSMAQFLGSANDLDGYVTSKTLDGLFSKIAVEEKAIRTNPVARTTDLLKKVFGSLGK
jgi:hypothetical protein